MTGLKTSKNKLTVKSLIFKGKSFDYLRSRGKIVVKKNEDFGMTCFEINDEG